MNCSANFEVTPLCQYVSSFISATDLSTIILSRCVSGTVLTTLDDNTVRKAITSDSDRAVPAMNTALYTLFIRRLYHACLKYILNFIYCFLSVSSLFLPSHISFPFPISFRITSFFSPIFSLITKSTLKADTPIPRTAHGNHHATFILH